MRGSTNVGELREHVGHLVAALAATDVDHDIRVRELGERLFDDRLSRAEAPGHRGVATLGDRKEEVEDALARDERPRTADAFGDGPWHAHRPAMREEELRAISERADRRAHGERTGSQCGKRSAHAGRDEDAVREGLAFDDGAEHVAWLHRLTGAAHGRERPRRACVERVGLRTWRDEVAGRLCDAGQWPADAVEHGAEQSRAELRGERRAREGDRLAHRESGGVLVHLQRGDIAAQP